MEKLLNTYDISDLLGVKPSTVRKWVHLGFIPHVKLGRAVRFEKKAIEEWVSEQSREGRLNQTPFFGL
jgi:excisionase family DNA binding protein